MKNGRMKFRTVPCSPSREVMGWSPGRRHGEPGSLGPGGRCRAGEERQAPGQAQPAHSGDPAHRRQVSHKERAGEGEGKIKTDLEALAGKHSYLKLSGSQQDAWALTSGDLKGSLAIILGANMDCGGGACAQLLSFINTF